MNTRDEFMEGGTHRAHYVRWPFRREPDFGVTSMRYDLAELLLACAGPKLILRIGQT